MENRFLDKTSLVFVLFAFAITAAVFTEQPDDVTVAEGSDAVFRCGTDLPCTFFYWGRYQASNGDFSYVSKCLTSYYQSKYSIEKEGNVYSLRVRSVSLEDSGAVYECWQYSQAGGGWLKSANATLTVVSQTTALVGSEPPVCSMDPPGPHSVGDTVTLACSYRGTTGQVPAKRLSWTTGKFTGKTQNRVVWTLSESDNFREFTCKPQTRTVDSLTTHPANCTLVPLAIPTNVSISPSGSHVVTEGGQVAFQCSAQAVPEATTYTWVLTKDGATVEPSQRFLTNGRTLHILGASSEDDGVEVICEASNEINITGRSLPSRLSIIPTSTQEPVSTDQPPTKKGKKSSSNPENLSQWSHMALVTGIMLCIVVVFVAAGMGVLYARWRRRMNEAVKDAAPASPSPEGGGVFSLHNPEADLMMGDGCVRAHAVPPDGFPLGHQSVPENVYTENVYMEILNQPQPCAPAPAHERAVENEPTYERHF